MADQLTEEQIAEFKVSQISIFFFLLLSYSLTLPILTFSLSLSLSYTHFSSTISPPFPPLFSPPNSLTLLTNQPVKKYLYKNVSRATTFITYFSFLLLYFFSLFNIIISNTHTHTN